MSSICLNSAAKSVSILKEEQAELLPLPSAWLIFHGYSVFSHLASYFSNLSSCLKLSLFNGDRCRYKGGALFDSRLFGEVYKPLKNTDWLPGSVAASALACFMWGYLLYSGDISSIWALFGVSNQLMASVGLIIGATVI
ncbi:carbon starvation CstA 5TM domain-containing protein [Bacillus licheniformis]|nr:carbon starvation CstA 5TM domain-containing protein [Bacillus licheniformis]